VDGPRFNVQLYRHLWGPSEFHATGAPREYDISPQMHRIRVPTLMICGEFDEARPESCRKFARMVAGSRTVIVPDASHSTMLEKKDYYLEAVRRFLQEAGL
jgi:L-proline amide hydrolase